METGKLNITVSRRATHDYTSTLRIDGTPVNLTGYTARLQARTEPDVDGVLVKELSTQNGGLTLGGSAGTIRRYISATDTGLLAVGVYWFDLLLVSTVAQDYLVRGMFRVQDGITTLAEEVAA